MGCSQQRKLEALVGSVGLGTRGLPQRSLALPGARRVPAKGSKHRQQVPSRLLDYSKPPCTESVRLGQREAK